MTSSQPAGPSSPRAGRRRSFRRAISTPGVTVDQANGLIAPGSVYRGVVADKTSPIVYGIPRNHLPVYYKNSTGPLFSVGGQPGPLAAAPALPTGRGAWRPRRHVSEHSADGRERERVWHVGSDQGLDASAAAGSCRARSCRWRSRCRRGGRGGGAGFGGGRGGGGSQAAAMLDFLQPRVILRFSSDARDMLLSGGNLGGENLENRPQVIDAPIGKGHVVMFAIRPFWRWQTSGDLHPRAEHADALERSQRGQVGC